MNKDEMREAFEKWWEDTKPIDSIKTLNLVDVWQAACKWQIKRDAEICAKKGKEYEQEWIKQKSICDTNLEGLGDGADECAYLILSQLKDKSNDH